MCPYIYRLLAHQWCQVHSSSAISRAASTTGQRRFAECKTICQELFIRHSANASFAKCPAPRPSAKYNPRQTVLCRRPGSRQRTTIGKTYFCRGSGSRQRRPSAKVAVGDGGHLPSGLPSALHLAIGKDFIIVF